MSEEYELPKVRQYVEAIVKKMMVAFETTLSNVLSVSDVRTIIDEHDSDTEAHEDIRTLISTKSVIGHTHATTDITGLSALIDQINASIATKAATEHDHAISDIINLESSLSDLSTAITASAQTLQASIDTKADVDHSHAYVKTNYLDASAFIAGDSPADAATYTSASGQKYGYRTFGNDQDASIDILYPMPEDWNRGSVKFKMVWMSSPDAAVGESGSLIVSNYSMRDGDPLDYTDIVNSVILTDVVQDVEMVHVSDASDAVNIANVSGPGDLVHLQVTRDVSEDTLASELRLMGIIMQYTCNQVVAAW